MKLVPTGQKTLLGQLYYLPLNQDSFVHFTPANRAAEILASGKLLMRPPYAKMGIDAVAAVSTVWGWHTPKVQTTHIKPGEGETVAILFKTATKPDEGYVEEVLWHRDVTLSGARIISASKGASLLRKTPQRLPDEQDEVTYDRPKLAERVAARWLQGSVEVRQTVNRGKGLFAARVIRRGERICHLEGSLVAADDKPNFQVGADTWMGPMGPAPDAVNHSCEPNCAAMVEQPRRPVVAMRDIQAGEEVTSDYSVTSTSPASGSFACMCGTQSCRDWAGGGFHTIPQAQQASYRAAGIVPSYVS